MGSSAAGRPTVMTVGRSRLAAQTGGSTRRARTTLPNNIRHSPDAVLMFGQRRRRWTNIKTALGECPVFARCVLAPIFYTHIQLH